MEDLYIGIVAFNFLFHKIYRTFPKVRFGGVLNPFPLFFFLLLLPSFLSLGNWVLAFYSLSLEEIPLSFASGERMRIPFLTDQGSKRSEVVFQWGPLSWEPNLDIWGETNLGVKVSISGRTSILFHKARVTMMI